MMEHFIKELQSLISAERYVNLHSKALKKKNQLLTGILSNLERENEGAFIQIHTEAFVGCETEEDEVKVVLPLLNQALKENGYPDSIHGAISITDALRKFNSNLERPFLAVFHFFKDEDDMKEKNIIRSIRKFIEIYEKSRFLAILIVSSKPTTHWELYPESNLDDRHIVFIEFG